MFNERKEEELEQLSPEMQEAKRKQRSTVRIFGLLCIVAAVLAAMLIYELILLF